MCGKYIIGVGDENTRLEELIGEAEATLPSGMSLTVRADGDVSPTDIVPVIVGDRSQPRAVAMRWGFRSERGLLINARAETALEKPMFRPSALERRCLLPASGYYEWNVRKERFLFRRADRGILYLAGLYRTAGDGLCEFVILTCDAYDEAKPIHDRMPVVITAVDEWLYDRASTPRILAAGGYTALEIERQSPEQLSMF